MTLLIKCWLAAEIWLASPFTGEGGGQHTSVDFVTDIWIFGSVCVCARTCTSSHFYVKGCPTWSAYNTNSPMWTNRSGMFMRPGCLPLLLHAVSLKKIADCITPFAGHRQSHLTAANENEQCKTDTTGPAQLNCGYLNTDANRRQ